VLRAWLIVIALVACGGKKPAHDDAAAVKPAEASVVHMQTQPGDAAVPAPPPRVEHAVWNLVDNRHEAHRAVAGEVVLDARGVDFARFTRFSLPAPRWHLGQTVDGQRAAIADRLALIELPLSDVNATQLTARVHGEQKQVIALKINGRKAAKDVQLEAGWQTVAFQIEKGRWIVGENQVAFETRGGRGEKKGAAFAWLRAGSTHPSADEDPLAALAFDGKDDSFELADGAEAAWYITIPDGANLVADVAGACHVEVAARASDGSLVGGLLGGDVHRVDLSPGAGKVVHLGLRARDCPRAKISHARITLHGPDPAALPAGKAPRFVIVWVMDALRADKIPIFTPGARAQTPNFDELAKSSTVFRQYYVQGNESQVSHSSIWTGLYPAVHGVRDIDIDKGGSWKLDSKLAVLARELQDAGFYTTAVTGNGFVNADGGYNRGFKDFRNMMREGGVMNNFIPGEKIVDAAIDQLAKHRDGPTYLFLGTIDTHGPWVARKPWIDIYSPGPYHGPFQEFGTAFDLGITPTSMGCAKIPPPADIERLRAIYDSAVSYHDHQLGRLIAQLKSWGIWDDTLLVVTADHGEELFEDTRCGHGGSLRDSLLRVPLLIHDPARFPAGTIVDEGAECVDLLPTILAAIGRPAPGAVQGEPLEPIAQGIGRGWPRPSYASMYEYAHAMRICRWKARVGPNGVPTIDDMVDDPGETKDFSPARPVERRYLTDHLSLFLALRRQWKKTAWGETTNVTAAGAAALDEAATP
jgi:arylsulfatase A-like enzyme